MQKSNTDNVQVEAPSLLPANKSRESLKNLDGWQSTEDHKRIYREFILRDFVAAIDLIDQIAVIAQDEKHHPDIHLTQYRNLRIGLTTHDVGGLSEKDFIVASRINDVPLNREHQQTEKQPKKAERTPTKKASIKKTLNRMDQRIKRSPKS